jgi:isocitrate dehydrogenase kinase/phosphatase
MRKIAINLETQKWNASHNLPVISKGLLFFYDTPCSTKVTMKKYVNNGLPEVFTEQGIFCNVHGEIFFRNKGRFLFNGLTGETGILFSVPISHSEVDEWTGDEC